MSDNASKTNMSSKFQAYKKTIEKKPLDFTSNNNYKPFFLTNSQNL